MSDVAKYKQLLLNGTFLFICSPYKVLWELGHYLFPLYSHRDILWSAIHSNLSDLNRYHLICCNAFISHTIL